MIAITFFEEDREPTPNKPNKIITGVVDDNAKIYIDRLEQENKQLNNILTELEEWLKEETIELYDKDNPMLLDQSYITYATERKMAYMYILDKIQELKEKYK